MRYLHSCMILAILGVSFSAAAATSVVVKPLSELLQETSQSAPAHVINENHAMVSARLSAPVEKVLVQVGDTVDAGQNLLRLECTDYELGKAKASSGLKALQAQTRLARQQLSRAERLLKQKNASKELRDQRRAELDSLLAQQEGAKAQLKEAELAVERCSVEAPFAGVVTGRAVSEGDLVAPGVMLLKVLAKDAQEVSADLSAQQVKSLKQSSKISFQFNGQDYFLNLRAIVPFIDNRARTQQVRFSFAENGALTGSSGRLIWRDAEGRLPIRYIVSRDGNLGVMKAAAGKAEFVALTGAIEGQAAVVDLPPETQIIVEGQHAVASGDEITITAQE